MSHLFRAGTTIVLVALIMGHSVLLSPHWRAVAADLQQAHPQARLEAGLLSLFRGGKG